MNSAWSRSAQLRLVAALAEPEDLCRAGLAGHLDAVERQLRGDRGAVAVDHRRHRLADDLEMLGVDVEIGAGLLAPAISSRGWSSCPDAIRAGMTASCSGLTST